MDDVSITHVPVSNVVMKLMLSATPFVSERAKGKPASSSFTQNRKTNKEKIID